MAQRKGNKGKEGGNMNSKIIQIVSLVVALVVEYFLTSGED